jgi:thymidylate kinase
MAKKDRKRIKVIDASRPPETVFADVLKAVARAL